MILSIRRAALAGVAVTALLAQPALADLIPIGTVPSSGAGLGAVNTLLTFQNTGTEVGAVGVTSTGGVGTGASYAYFGALTPTAGATHETTGAGNNIYTPAGLGLTSFSNLVLIFNGNEGGGADQPITLDKLSLNLYSSTGTILGSFDTTQPYTFPAFPGVGQAGYGFQLDSTQAAQANLLLASNPTLRIGGAAQASGASAGPESIFISTLTSGNPPTVPDSGSTVALLGLGLVLVAGLQRRLRR